MIHGQDGKQGRYPPSYAEQLDSLKEGADLDPVDAVILAQAVRPQSHSTEETWEVIPGPVGDAEKGSRRLGKISAVEVMPLEQPLE